MRVATAPYQFVIGKQDLLPLCQVHLLGRQRVAITVMIDSGATHAIFPRKAAEDAGILLPPYPNFPIQYGSGSVDGRRVRVHLELHSKRWDTEVVFVERLDFRYGLLGRHGVFAQFNEVAFLERTNPPRAEFRW